MQPIETSYQGCRFRSRLEARWAVFLDSIGVPWQYEPQGYVLAGKPYLPDFWVPMPAGFGDRGWGHWIEIKPTPLTTEQSFLLGELARDTGHRTYSFCGSPWPGEYNVSIFMHHHHHVPTDVPEVPEAQIIEVDNQFHDGSLTGDSDLRLITPDKQTHPFVTSFPFWSGRTGSLAQAFEAARSARFEHGESPRIPSPRGRAQ